MMPMNIWNELFTNLELSTMLILIKISGLIVAFLLVTIMSRKIVKKFSKKFPEKAKKDIYKTVFSSALLKRIANLVPAILAISLLPSLFLENQNVVILFQKLFSVYIIISVVIIANTLIDISNVIYKKSKASRKMPIKGYLQVIKIIIAVIAGSLIFATLLGKSPTALLSGIGALSAVLMLIFKDSILGLVAGVQLSTNNMVQLGDWIEMPSHGADGEVIDITLQTVQVQNWDKTITSIPVYELVSNSFKNWCGMSESGGRRIKRVLNIDVNTVHFCSAEQLADFKKINLLKDYLQTKETELVTHNESVVASGESLINRRELTNIGTFRAYLESYLKSHPKINSEMTCMVRQLASTEKGLPLEIYVFCNEKEWVAYEAIQSDIFDHIFAILPKFGLRVYQDLSLIEGV